MQKYDCFEDIQKIEQKIFTLVGKYNKGLTQNEKIELHELFSDRERLLNKSCPFTEENLSALKEINRELESLTLLNRKRALDLVRLISEAGICGKDDNWTINAYLFVDGDMGGIELSDEKAYGSNFNKMRPILASAQEYISLKPFNIEDERFAEEEIFDETLSEDPQLVHWNEHDYAPETIHQWFVEIVRGCDWIGHYQKALSPALHKLLCYRFWSVPDLLRLRFGIEAEVELIVDHELEKGNKMIEERKYSCYDRVCEIEKQIIGKRPFIFTHLEDMNEGELAHIKEQLTERKDLLNASCPDTEENQKLFWEVTQRLVLLNEQNHIKAKRIVEKLLQSPIYAGETDWCIQAGIELGRKGNATILQDEQNYGSLFNRMNSFLSKHQRYLNQRFSSEDFVVGAREYWRSFCLKDPMLSDWNQFESDSHTRNWLTNTAYYCQWLSDQSLSIPWIAHEMLDLRYWSVPDYLRLSNSLSGIVKLLVQHYVDGYGNKIVET